MAHCRTSALGGHVEVCPECGDMHISYNSCRDRHCPKCQNKEREQWIEFRREEIIPVKYFHVVFTVPACLHSVAMAHQREFYDCMFKAAWATVDAFAAKKGLTSGMTAILHTWGSNLFYHPHIHCIVPGGGVDKRGVWHHLKGCKHSDFLFPVAAMSTKFRGRFMSLLTRRLKEKGVIIDQSIRKHCAYRVAITNSRILDVTDGTISYDYKDYRSGGKHKVKTESIDTFLNFLSQHILPDRFVRIRHYGILSPCNREKLRCVQRQFDVPPVPKERKKRSYIEICNEKGWDIGICKDCNCQRIIMRIIKPAPRAPPSIVWHIGR